MNEIQRYLRIVRLIRDGKTEQLGKDDYKFFSKFTFEVDKEAIKKLQNTKEFKDLSDEDVSAAMQNSFLEAVQKPELREQLLISAQEQEKAETASKITSALNIALGATDVLTSSAQVRAANRAQARLKRPGRPTPLTEEPLLEGALSDASRGDLDAARAMSPAQLAILDQYLSDLNTAKTVSGGQAGTYGALAQTASTRRGRRSMELAPVYDEISRRGEQRYDQLLAQKLQQNQNIQQSQSQYYPYDLQQYNIDAQAAGSLGATGRQNLRSSLGAVSGFLPNVLSDLRTRKRFRDIYNQGLAYDEKNARIMADADFDLQSMYDNQDFNPAYQQQYEQLYGIPS